jgi:hypothetical protein
MCGDTVFSTHKIIICHMSRYFKAAFHGKFRVRIAVSSEVMDGVPAHKKVWFRNHADA